MADTRLASRALQRVVTGFLKVGAHRPELEQLRSRHRTQHRRWAPTSSVLCPDRAEQRDATKRLECVLDAGSLTETHAVRGMSGRDDPRT